MGRLTPGCVDCGTPFPEAPRYLINHNRCKRCYNARNVSNAKLRRAGLARSRSARTHCKTCAVPVTPENTYSGVMSYCKTCDHKRRVQFKRTKKIASIVARRINRFPSVSSVTRRNTICSVRLGAP